MVKLMPMAENLELAAEPVVKEGNTPTAVNPETGEVIGFVQGGEGQTATEFEPA